MSRWRRQQHKRARRAREALTTVFLDARGNRGRHPPGGHRGIGTAFAPSSELLRWGLARRGDGQLREEDWSTYEAKFLDEMRQSYVLRRPAWDMLLKLEHVVLLCFCTTPAQCHRVVLARLVLSKLGATYAGEIS